VSEAIGYISATQAIEYVRLHELTDRLWASNHTGPAVRPSGWRIRLFRAFTVLEPAYAWGMRRGWQWLPAARRRIRDALRSQS
jgi:hypothetical protein